MATIMKGLKLSCLENVIKCFVSRSFHSKIALRRRLLDYKSIPSAFSCGIAQSCNFHTSRKMNDLMEFFDDPKNFGADVVKVGRSWTKDDLRIKSNSDLHKLWYVLLKEHNMLLTMEYTAKKECEIFPNPERIDKVRDSMANLEEVVRERNRAYFELETGETGERPFDTRRDAFGRQYRYRKIEHMIPETFNTTFRQKYQFYGFGKDVLDFQAQLNEKQMIRKNWLRKAQYRRCRALLRRFPNMDIEVLKEKFPDLRVEELVKWIGDVQYEDFEPRESVQ